MIEQVCLECKNFFVRPSVDIHQGLYTVNNGQLDPAPSFILPGQYYRIVGSTFSDGVYCRGVDDTDLTDETFVGALWAMKVPRDFLEIVAEIQQWCADTAKAVNSPYNSESFGGYSYSRATGADGGAISWQSQFGKRLNAYRRIDVL